MVVDDLRFEAFRMSQHALHQIGAEHAVRVAGPVVNRGRGRQLPSLLHAGHQDRLQVGAGRVNGGSVPGRAGPQDQKTVMAFIHIDNLPEKCLSCCRQAVKIALSTL